MISLHGCCRLSRKWHSRETGCLLNASHPQVCEQQCGWCRDWKEDPSPDPRHETLEAGGVVSCSRGKQRPGCLAKEICKEGLKAQPTFFWLLSGLEVKGAWREEWLKKGTNS